MTCAALSLICASYTRTAGHPGLNTVFILAFSYCNRNPGLTSDLLFPLHVVIMASTLIVSHGARKSTVKTTPNTTLQEVSLPFLSVASMGSLIGGCVE